MCLSGTLSSSKVYVPLHKQGGMFLLLLLAT
jgi:hypothetical protein